MAEVASFYIKSIGRFKPNKNSVQELEGVQIMNNGSDSKFTGPKQKI